MTSKNKNPKSCNQMYLIILIVFLIYRNNFCPSFSCVGENIKSNKLAKIEENNQIC